MSGPAIASSAHEAFWASTLSLLLVAIGCALLVGLAAMLVLRRRPGSELRARVRAFVEASGASQEEGAEGARRTSGLLARAERSLERERWWDGFKENLEIARIARPAIEIVYLTVAGSLAVAIVLSVATGTPYVGVIGLVLVPLLARSLIYRRLRIQRIRFGDQLPAHLQELAAAMRAGHSIVSGIAAIVDGAAEPTRREFQRVVADERLGMPLQEALGIVAARMDAQDMEQVSLVADLNRRTGGNMAEVLDRVAEAVRERAELNRELRTLTAQARMSRWIVTSIPPGLLVVIALLNPNYISPLLHTGTGQVLLAAAVVMIVAGSLVMGRIVRITV